MRYLFSVVMAVYNTERYLREAVNSLIHQDIGFDRIQLILVDDGSTDVSGAICDKYAEQYPNNIHVLHKPNGGVSSARNAGLEYVQGKYVNFMDSDDRLSPDAFSKVFAFFEIHQEETDVVSIPIYYFEGKTGSHMLNDKFEKGTRIIDLRIAWTYIQMSVTAAFIRRECLSHFCFKPELQYAEDSDLMQRILLQKQTIGVVANAAYFYRVRSTGDVSAIQGCVYNPVYYLKKIEHFSEALVSHCLKEYEEIPRFIQYALMYDLQWYVRRQQLPPGVLSVEEERIFLAKLARLLIYVDDEVIFTQKYLRPEHWYYVISKKYGIVPQITYTQNGIQIICNGCCVGTVPNPTVTVGFIHLEKDRCLLEATVPVFPGNEISILTDCVGMEFPCEVCRKESSSMVFGEECLLNIAVRFSIPLSGSGKPLFFRILLEQHTFRLALSCDFSRFSPLSLRHKNSYYCHAGWCIQYKAGVFSISSVKVGTRFKKECLYLLELLFGKYHQRKMALKRIYNWMIWPWNHTSL